MSVDKIDAKHRTSNVGTYNRHVHECYACSANLDIFGQHCMGFGSPPVRAAYIDKDVAVVSECPRCFERQWSHCTVEGGYHEYLRFLHFAGAKAR